MGSAYDSPILDWRDERLNFDHPANLDGDISGGFVTEDDGFRVSAPLDRAQYSPERHKRLIDAAKDIFAAHAGRRSELSAFLAMQDARLFPSVEYLGFPLQGACVQLSYARTVLPQWRLGTEVVLWPLTNDFKWWKLPTSSPLPWSQREPKLMWRGQPTGMSYDLGLEARPILTGIRKVRRWLNGWLKDEVADNESTFRAWAGSYQRLKAVSICRNLPDTDVRLVPLFDGDRKSVEVAGKFLGTEVLSERVDLKTHLSAQQRFKYTLSLPGNDVPSSLRHDLLSGCLVLMPRPFWESSWFFGLKPDIHYIPLRADLADLEERLQWCRDNDGHCKEIAENARVFALEHFDPALDQKVQSRLVERLAQMTTPMTGS